MPVEVTQTFQLRSAQTGVIDGWLPITAVVKLHSKGNFELRCIFDCGSHLVTFGLCCRALVKYFHILAMLALSFFHDYIENSSYV